MPSPDVVAEAVPADTADDTDDAEPAGPTASPDVVTDGLEELNDATERAAAAAGAVAGDVEASADHDQDADAVTVEETVADPVFSGPDDSGGFFDGTDDAPGGGSDAGGTGAAGEARDAARETAEQLEDAVDFEDTINNGLARLSVVGLDDHQGKDELREEFVEVFQEFKLGHYGDQCMHEYIVADDDDIDPIWGFCGALVLCLALVVYMRPDGEAIVDNATDKIANLGGMV